MSYFITNIATTPVTGTFSNGVPSGIDNNHANVRNAGNVPAGGDTSSNALGEGNPITTVSSGVGNTFATGPGTWNQQSQFQNIVRVTNTIAGISNTALVAGGSDSANDANTPLQAATMKVRLYKTAIRAGNWNEYSGSWSSTPSVVESGGYDIAGSQDNTSTLKASGVDHAANPTSAEPGELQYDLGGLPVQTGYQPKYLW
tara:strand:+ start:172 stop:774 length:603 start_codon:yes stop_codon:yes gene_type:complete